MLRTCPNCYEKWTVRESWEASHRLWHGSRYVTDREGVSLEICVEGEEPHIAIFPGYPKESPHSVWNPATWSEKRSYRDRRVLHFIVSIPDGGQSLKTNRRITRDMAKSHGLVGGLMIEHPFRIDEGDGQYHPDGYIHFHGIGVAFGDVLPGGLEGDGDCIFKVIEDPNDPGHYNGFRRMRDVRRAIRYLLTHCGIREGHHALTWWGELSYNMLSNEELERFAGRLEEAEGGPPCPFCGSTNTERCDVMDIMRVPWAYGMIGIHPMPDQDSPVVSKREFRSSSVQEVLD
jgi:hypothetical protein